MVSVCPAMRAGEGLSALHPGTVAVCRLAPVAAALRAAATRKLPISVMPIVPAFTAVIASSTDIAATLERIPLDLFTMSRK